MSKKLQKLQDQLDQVRRQIKEEEERIKKKEEEDRQRRIQIIGSFYLAEAKKKGTLTSLAKTLDKEGYLKKSDRVLFDLDEPSSTTATAPKKSSANVEPPATV